MTDLEPQEVALEMAADLRSAYIKPNLELLEVWSKTIGVTIPIEP
jgi:hypothetical protein